MSESRTESGVYVCDECGEVSFGDPSCCDESASAVEATPVEHPDLSGVLREVFGISETGLKVCLCLMEDGESTAADIADRLGIDRSTVGRQLNHLTDIGVLDKRQRLLKEGGYVHVYSPVPVEEVRRRLTVGLLAWTDEALDIVEHVNREKLDALARADGDAGDEQASIYWDG
ncbi:helix-turn-helix domain-containing protein [Halorussus caseinilyticus]|uniref:helix-turn-helix domain-containing protein n=1 Tax=Halorussus caseinilyticus TaxID=3034025 RepID=UPI0023E8FA97|nr:helix-turn-helix domain-containing protein [Halorussus sp. DT72]